jgi:Ca2+/Na+ antiporter
MSAGKIIASIGAAILLLLGVLFIMATFSSTGQLGWLIVGIVLVLIAFGLIWFVTRKPKAEAPVNVTYKVDLSGDVSLETMKCKTCGGSLSSDNVKMVAGAPVVTCPYCGSTYQLAEEPKW